MNIIDYQKEVINLIDNCFKKNQISHAYIFEGERGSGLICVNGAAAHLVNVGDIIIIMAYTWMTEEEAKIFKPAVVFPDTQTNKLV